MSKVSGWSICVTIAIRWAFTNPRRDCNVQQRRRKEEQHKAKTQGVSVKVGMCGISAKWPHLLLHYQISRGSHYDMTGEWMRVSRLRSDRRRTSESPVHGRTVALLSRLEISCWDVQRFFFLVDVMEVKKTSELMGMARSPQTWTAAFFYGHGWQYWWSAVNKDFVQTLQNVFARWSPRTLEEVVFCYIS